ncbi:MAG: hypothetical protein JJ958_12110 [Balneola sp.]|nr:hypothetical protein [Balneola sp.]
MKYSLFILFFLLICCSKSKTDQNLTETPTFEEPRAEIRTDSSENQLEEISLPLPETIEVDIDGITSYRDNPWKEFSVYRYKDQSAIGLIYPDDGGVSLFVIKDKGIKKIMNSNGFPVTVFTTYIAVEPTDECIFTLMNESANPRYLSYTCKQTPNAVGRWKL